MLTGILVHAAMASAPRPSQRAHYRPFHYPSITDLDERREHYQQAWGKKALEASFTPSLGLFPWHITFYSLH